MRKIDPNIITSIFRVIMERRPRIWKSLYCLVTSEKYLNRSISGSTLNKHISTLRSLHYLEPHELELTPSTKEKFLLGILQFPIFHARNNKRKNQIKSNFITQDFGMAYKKRKTKKKESVIRLYEKTNEARRKEKILVMILYQAVFGSGRHLPTNIALAGDILIDKPYRYHPLPGTGISDFLTDSKNINLGSIFNDIDFNRDEVEEVFKSLEDKGILKKIKTGQSNTNSFPEERMTISNHLLSELIREIILIFTDACLRMRCWWVHVKPPGRSGQEREWYEMMYGEKGTDNDFSKYFSKSLRLGKKIKISNINTRLTHRNYPIDPAIHKIIRSCDLTIRFRYNIIRTKYAVVFNNYQSFLEFLLNEICYPKFLQDLNEKAI